MRVTDTRENAVFLRNAPHNSRFAMEVSSFSPAFESDACADPPLPGKMQRFSSKPGATLVGPPIPAVSQLKYPGSGR